MNEYIKSVECVICEGYFYPDPDNCNTTTFTTEEGGELKGICYKCGDEIIAKASKRSKV